MTRALSRALPAILGILLALALGCASTHPFPVEKKGTHAVVVGPKAKNISIDKLRLSKGDGDVAFWASDKKGKTLSIEFETEVFDNMTHLGNGRWQVTCRSRQCFSDEIKVPYNEGGEARNTYKYWQVLTVGTEQDTADGIIIIDP